MAATIIDGKALALQIQHTILSKVTDRVKLNQPIPGLAVILVGEDPASLIYVGNKRKACQEVGIESFYFPLAQDTPAKTLIQLIKKLNDDPKINGILLQLPLPAHHDCHAILELIDPKKDVDGFHPYNLGRLAQGRPILRPCTPFGIIQMLDAIGETYQDKHAVIIGDSNIVGRPMALELLLRGCTISICHRLTQDLKHFVNQADILISATGKPGLIKGAWIKTGATIIDVGIHRLANGKIMGDVEFQKALMHAAHITPVPGGVGPMTIATLLQNTFIATQLQNG